MTAAKRRASRKRRLESALNALVDYQGDITDALCMAPGVQGAQHDIHNVCAALRAIVDDGWEKT